MSKIQRILYCTFRWFSWNADHLQSSGFYHNFNISSFFLFTYWHCRLLSAYLKSCSMNAGFWRSAYFPAKPILKAIDRYDFYLIIYGNLSIQSIQSHLSLNYYLVLYMLCLFQGISLREMKKKHSISHIVCTSNTSFYQNWIDACDLNNQKKRKKINTYETYPFIYIFCFCWFELLVL